MIDLSLAIDSLCQEIENGSAGQLQCIRFMNEPEMICRYSLKWVSMTKCCYNYEKEYFYCCPHPEARRLEYATRITGILIIVVLFIIMVLLLCVFCTRCPIGRAIHKRRIINRQIEEEML
ncbi:hypothetical protein PV328_009649 [Microctonus aethiopoides]|uniref:Uncharacterized protein n=1 Tax=Microctonus aethiopoides TaxID=144406 RepID=A0AA39C6F1_9HYME|nr:hypothetical protein PV328_009649 [Microctonus aethiopoides]